MIDAPTIGGDVSIVEALFGVLLFVTGYVVHEVMHLIPLQLWGHDYDVAILPTKEGQSKLSALFVGTVVRITTEENIPRWHVVVSALAPGVVALVPLGILAIAFTYPVVDIGTLLVLGLWFAVSIPSLRDWLTVFEYSGNRTVEATTEVQ